MGSVAMPSSSWQPSQAGTGISGEEEIQVVFDFGSVQQVKEVYIFLADAKRTKFDLYGSGVGEPKQQPEEWNKLLSYDNDPAKNVHFCSWDKRDLGNTSTRFLKFVFDAEESEGKIGEILVISAENKKIEPVEVSVENATRLVDEQEMIKLPITQKYGAYFDEMYFVRTAEEHLNLEEPYETTHPPLGKLIIALGILCFGMNPFGWRILGVLAATAMIPIMFFFGKRMFGSSVAGFFAAFLLTFEFMHFSLARLATGEIYILLFSLLMFYFAFDYFYRREEGGGGSGEKKGTSTSLFISIIFFGLCFTVKWTAVFGLVAILILLLVSNLRNSKPIFSDFKIILAALFVSAAIYIATYIPYMFSGGGHGLLAIHRFPLYLRYTSEYMSGGNVSIVPPIPLTVFDLQLGMFVYHAGIEATHPFSSSWWSWHLMLKPLWLYFNSLDGTVSTIVLMGNPAIWWGSILALILIAAKFVADKVRKTEHHEHWHSYVYLFILVPFLLQWLSYALITRILFIYHFVANVPFMIFALTYWLNLSFEKEWSSKRRSLFFKCIVIAFLILTAVLFLLFYPAISGYPVAYEYKESLRWLSGWTF